MSFGVPWRLNRSNPLSASRLAPTLTTAAALAAALLMPLSADARLLGGHKAKKPPKPPPAPVLTAADYRAVDPGNLLVIDTSKGRVLVEMLPEAAPAHVERLRTLAHEHFYDGQTFFRVIDEFMDQTGDPTNTGSGGSKLPDLKAEFTFRRGPQTPFVKVTEPSGGETGFVGALPVSSQTSALMGMTADGRVAAWPIFCPGVAAMARADSPDSANSQFFLMRQSYPSLEKRYTGWGRVVSGLEAVRAVKVGEPVEQPQDLMKTVRLAADLPEAERPKVSVLDPASPGGRAVIERLRADKGADFSICDVDLPAKVG